MKEIHMMAPILINQQGQGGFSDSRSHCSSFEDHLVAKLSNEALDPTKATPIQNPQIGFKQEKGSPFLFHGESHLPNFNHPSCSFLSSPGIVSYFTPSLTCHSNYLLQNLIFGSMHEAGSSFYKLSQFETPLGTALISPLPNQPGTSQSVDLQSYMRASTVVENSEIGGETESSDESSSSTNISRITDLSAKIVSQLNGLLFLVDCRKIPRMETNILHQLSTIYSRLQDILIMVEKSKNSSVSLKTDEFTIQNVKSDLESDYSKHSNDADRVFGLNQQRNYATFEMKDQTSFESTEPKEAKKTKNKSSEACCRRRGRPPKNSNLYLSFIPQEKKIKISQQENMTPSDVPKSDRLLGDLVGQHDAALNSIDSNNSCQSSGNIKANTKGIRNRVFCGECKGCLKNEDCGICRYCIDKTKFGGLNRLRQKCVHRRCENDNHRRRAFQISPTFGGDTKQSEAESSRPSSSLCAEGRGENFSFDQSQSDTNNDNHFGTKGVITVTCGSDEDLDDQRAGRGLSRIDRWKVKHEAMLKSNILSIRSGENLNPVAHAKIDYKDLEVN